MNLYNESHKANLPKEKIIALYFNQKLTTRATAAALSVSQCTLRRYMKNYGLEARHGNIAYTRRRGPPRKLTCSRENLNILYWIEKLSVAKIAKIYNVSSYCIECNMRRHNIPTRKQYHPMGLIPWNKGKKRCFGRKTIIRMSKAKRGKHLSLSTEFKVGHTESITAKTMRVARVFSSLTKRPTTPEKSLSRIIKSHKLPYTYNGNKADLIIGGRVPDFYNNNGEKIVVEVFGQVFHKPDLFLRAFKRRMPHSKTLNGTIEHYAQYGFQCIVFWEDELQSLDSEFDIVKRLTV